MTIKRTTLYQVIIYLILFFNLGFLNFRKNVDIYSMIVSTILSVLLFFIYLSQKTKQYVRPWVNYYILLIYLLLMIEFFRIYFYPNGTITFDRAIQMYKYFFLMLIVYPLNEILNSDSNISKDFLRGLCILGYIVLIYRAFLWGIYNFFNINIAPGMFNVDWIRNLGGITFTRLGGTFLDGYVLIYSLIKSTYEKRKSYIIGVLFILFYAIVIVQSRAGILQYILIILFFSFLNSINSKSKVLSTLILIFFIVIVILYNFSVIKGFFNTFSVNNDQYGASTLNRLNGWTFYKDLWKNSNFWLGIGFLPDQIQITSILTYYLADYNTWINFYEFGFIGMLIFMIPILEGIKLFIRDSFNIMKSKICFLQIGMVVFIIINALIQNIYWSQNICMLPIFIGIITMRQIYEKN